MAEDVVLFDDRKVKKLIKTKLARLGKINKKTAGIVQSVALEDVKEHFAREMGPSGKWKSWSQKYAEYKQKIGKSGDNILQDTGILRQNALTPTNIRFFKEGIILFSNVKTAKGYPYGAAHNYGYRPYPARPYMWLSKGGLRKMTRQILAYLGKR